GGGAAENTPDSPHNLRPIKLERNGLAPGRAGQGRQADMLPDTPGARARACGRINEYVAEHYSAVLLSSPGQAGGGLFQRTLVSGSQQQHCAPRPVPKPAPVPSRPRGPDPDPDPEAPAGGGCGRGDAYSEPGACMTPCCRERLLVGPMEDESRGNSPDMRSASSSSLVPRLERCSYESQRVTGSSDESRVGTAGVGAGEGSRGSGVGEKCSSTAPSRGKRRSAHGPPKCVNVAHLHHLTSTSPRSCSPRRPRSAATFTVKARASSATQYTAEVCTGTRPSYTRRKARQPPGPSARPRPPPGSGPASAPAGWLGSNDGAPSTVTCVRYSGAELILMEPESRPEK
ncbi:Structural maintenance of chromosomes protein 4, partial [Frankliniella fusca]